MITAKCAEQSLFLALVFRILLWIFYKVMNMETAIVIFLNKNTNFKVEIEIPLNITANDLIYALNKAFDLELNSEDIFDCYLVSENPIAFLKGNRN